MELGDRVTITRPGFTDATGRVYGPFRFHGREGIVTDILDDGYFVVTFADGKWEVCDDSEVKDA